MRISNVHRLKNQFMRNNRCIEFDSFMLYLYFDNEFHSIHSRIHTWDYLVHFDIFHHSNNDTDLEL